MNDFLRKSKLSDSLRTELPLEKELFRARLQAQVDKGDPSGFIPANEMYSRSKNVYLGHVGSADFKFRRKRRMFEFNMNFSVAEGTFQQQGDRLVIDTEIKGLVGIMKIILPFSLVIYGIMLLFIVLSGEPESMMLLPFVFLHAALLYTIAYFMMRRGVANMKRTLEREFFYLTKE